MNDMTQQEDDYLIFQPVNSKLQREKDGQEPDNEPYPIPGEFDSLYDELLYRCNPGNFLNPYDERKASISNEIYSQALSNKKDIEVLKKLRIKAIHDLGVKFSTVAIYSRLAGICDPKLYTDEYYDASKFEKANRLFAKIKQNADNIEILECIEAESSDLEEVINQRRRQVQEQKEKEKQAEEIKRQMENELFIMEEQEKEYGIYIGALGIVSMLTIPIAISSAFSNVATVAGVFAVFTITAMLGIVHSIHKLKDVSKRIKDFKQQNNIG